MDMLPHHTHLFENASSTLHIHTEQSLLVGRNGLALHYITLKGSVEEGSRGNAICERLIPVLTHVINTLKSGFFVVDIAQLNYTFGNSIWFPLSMFINESSIITGDGPARNAIKTLSDASLGKEKISQLGTFTRNIEDILSEMGVTKEALEENILYRRIKPDYRL
jgi:hypothetical protein